MSGGIGFAVAFGAGVLSFVSPCVLPLIPGYLSYLTGLSAAELGEVRRPSRSVLVPALLFVAGFTLVFVAFGATASVLGQALIPYREPAEKIGGVLLVAFGVLLLGVIPVPWLYREARLDPAVSERFGGAGAFVMGLAFAAGWTPCVGPVLGSILSMAGSSGTVARGSALLLAYSLGLGLPFVIVAAVFGRLRVLIRSVSKHSLLLNRAAGVLLVLTGLAILTGRFADFAAWLARFTPFGGL